MPKAPVFEEREGSHCGGPGGGGESHKPSQEVGWATEERVGLTPRQRGAQKGLSPAASDRHGDAAAPWALSPQVQRCHRGVAGGRGSDQDGLSGEQVLKPGGQGWAGFSHADVSSCSLSSTPTLFFLTLGNSLRYCIFNFY